MSDADSRPRVMVLVPTTTYRSSDYLAAAESAGVRLVVGCERKQALQDHAPGGTCVVPWADPERARAAVTRFHERFPLSGVVGADDETVEAAAAVADAFGWPAPSPKAVAVARDKAALRRVLTESGRRQPEFRTIERRVCLRDRSTGRAAQAPAWSHWPAILKPRTLAASRGVMRVDDGRALDLARARLFAMLADHEAVPDRRSIRDSALLEAFVPGNEVAFEGLLQAGRLHPLATFDKPHPLNGPTFAETLYTTPSVAEDETLRGVEAEVVACCAAIGLTEGPVHAELRLAQNGPVLLELAPRTLGGLCPRVLSFGSGISLETLVLRHAAGLPIEASDLRGRGGGAVFMIPVVRGGTLERVRGIERAAAEPGIGGVDITARPGDVLVPLPEGNRYVGFVWARADTATTARRIVERALSRLTVVVRDGDALAEVPGDALP
ncbi:MAG: ATP-grasp domain-containing protein [Planctomycetota bacterium]|nr:ATP-grasp domain-containing protein [Planctomycetota bacterium]